MKKFITTIFTLILAVTVFATTPAMAENNFEMTVPDGDEYLYLENPVQIAADETSLAIYDEATKKVVVSGDSLVYVDVSAAAQYGTVTDLEFYDGQIFVLVEGEEFKLFAYDLSGTELTDSFVSEIQTPSAIGRFGNKLYVFDGYRTITEINLTDGTSQNFNSKKPLFSKLVAADDANVYSLSFEGVLTTISLSDKSIKQKQLSLANATDLLPYDGSLYVACADGFYQVDSGTKLFDVAISDSYVLDGKLYVLDGTTTISLYDKASGTVKEIGSSSNKEGKLKNPTDVATYGSLIAVADSGNGRVQLFDRGNSKPVYVLKCGAVSDLVWSANNLYVLSNGKLYTVSSGEQGYSSTVISVSEDYTRLASDGNRLYAFNSRSGCLQMFTGGAFTGNFGSATGGTSFKTSPIGKIIYYLADNAVKGCSSVGPIDVSLSLDGSSAIDFVVDAKGSLYVLSENQNHVITKYERKLDGYVEVSSTVLENDRLQLGQVSALEVDSDGNLYVVSNSRHFVAKVSDNLGFETQAATYTEPSLESVEGSNDVYVASLLPCLMQKDTSDFESVTPTAGVDCVVFKSLSDQTFSYVMTSEGKFGYVLTDKITAEKTDSTPSFTELKMLHTSGGEVYTYPLFDEAAIQNSVDNKTLLTVIGSGSDFHIGNHYWYEVSYTLNGTAYTGYVLRTRVVDYSASQIAEPVASGRIASGIASTVNIYSLSDEKSEILQTLTEGDRIELLEEYDENREFTLVRFNPIDGNECIGYVKTKFISLQTGLTDGQIIGIVLAAVCAVVTAAVVLFTKRAKQTY